MYLYLYDSFLNGKKYSHLLAKIETRLTDLGVGGKIFRLSPLRNVTELLNDEVRNGVKTIIAVGNDKTFTEIINVAAKLDVTMGIIPVGSENSIAKTLGVPSAEDACATIAARIVERVDLGKANGVYFLSSLSVAEGEITIECENKFKLIPRITDQVSICNLNPALSFASHSEPSYFNPKDGVLEVLIKPLSRGGFFRKATNEQDSVIPFREIALRSKDSVPVITDGKKVLKTPVQIKIVPKKLRVIVGKNRVF